jgi:hypothetical protein
MQCTDSLIGNVHYVLNRMHPCLFFLQVTRTGNVLGAVELAKVHIDDEDITDMTDTDITDMTDTDITDMTDITQSARVGNRNSKGAPAAEHTRPH